jgi:hypothetical protein
METAMKTALALPGHLKPWLAGLISVLVILAGSLVWMPSAHAATTLIYATFKGDAVADEELWIYQSTDGGANYSVLADTHFRGPTGVLRDPSITNYNGRYYVAYTVQSWTTNSTYFNIASSNDLTNWTNIASVNSGIANTKYTWAPEFYLEGSTVRIIANVAQTTCSNCFQPYVYTAQNTNLTSWSGPAQMGGLGFNHIDTFVVKSGNTWHAFAKNETTKYLEHWTSTSGLTSGWADRGTLWSSGYEGPAAVRLENGSWRMYVDKYPSGGIWTATSSDLNTWTGLSSAGCSGCRHGTAIAKGTASSSGSAVVRGVGSNRCLDVPNQATGNGTLLQIYDCNGGANQAWNYLSDGELQVYGGKCLDVPGHATAAGTRVDIWDCNAGANQQWNLNSDGTVVGRESGLCLDVTGAGTANATAVEIWTCTGTGNQKWSRQ